MGAPRLVLGGRFLALVYLFVIAFLLLATLVPLVVAQWRPLAVVSGSMQPAVEPGSVVMVQPIEVDQFYADPTIVAFDDPARPGTMTTHRVIDTVADEGGTAVYTTKGDANRVADSTPIAHDDVFGAVRMVVPFVGLLAAWLANGQVALLVSFIALTLVAVGALALPAQP